MKNLNYIVVVALVFSANLGFSQAGKIEPKAKKPMRVEMNEKAAVAEWEDLLQKLEIYPRSGELVKLEDVEEQYRSKFKKELPAEYKDSYLIYKKHFLGAEHKSQFNSDFLSFLEKDQLVEALDKLSLMNRSNKTVIDPVTQSEGGNAMGTQGALTIEDEASANSAGVRK